MTKAAIYLGDWDSLDIYTVTNLFLYGTLETPANYGDRLRTQETYNDLPLNGDSESVLQVKIEMDTFMDTGPGRYARASEAAFVQDFFGGLVTLSDGVYSKDDIIAAGITAGKTYTDADFRFIVKQYETDIGSTDYAARTYIFNSGGYEISDAAQFHIDNGVVWIDNLAVHALNDNFDFESDGFWSQLGDYLVLESEIDPYDLGRMIEIQIINKTSVSTVDGYDSSDFTNDQTYVSSITDGDILDAYSAMQDVLSQLHSENIIEYDTSNGHIIYGTNGNETLYGTSGKDIIITGEGTDLVSAAGDNDIIYVGGGGSKTIDGGSGTDTINFSAFNNAVYYTLVDLSKGTYSTTPPQGHYETGSFTSIENITGRSVDPNTPYNGVDELIGNSGNNIIDGRGGSDSIVGNGGSDTFIWGSDYHGHLYINDASSDDYIQLVDMTTNQITGFIQYYGEFYQDALITFYYNSDVYDPRYPNQLVPTDVMITMYVHVTEMPSFVNPNNSVVSAQDLIVNYSPGYGHDGGWGGVRSDAGHGAPIQPFDPSPSPTPWVPPAYPGSAPPLVSPVLPHIPEPEPDPENPDPGEPEPPALLDPPEVPYGPGSCPALIGPIAGTYSPLVIDLGNDGLTLTSLSSGAVYWDVDNDGKREATAWFGSAEGILVMDWNGNGYIDNHSELFGTKTIDGFTKLAELDSNNDHIINSIDADFSNLQVWIDANGDGVSQAGELYSLTDLNIQSINLTATSINTVISGNTVDWQSTVTMTDSSTRDIYDAWLQSDNQNTIYDGFVPINPDVLKLPFLRGFGEIKDSDIQMSLDKSLFFQVANLSLMRQEDVFDPSKNFDEQFHSMLYKWDGLSNTQNSTLSSYEDYRKWYFICDVAGQSKGEINALGLYQAEYFRDEGLWEKVVTYYEGNFLYQTVLHDLFTGTHAYDVYSGTVTGATGISSTVLSDVEDIINATDDPAYGWSLVIRTVQAVIGIDNLDSTSYDLLDDAIQLSVPSLSLDTIYHLIDGDPNDVTGTSGNDILTGTFADDQLEGLYGDDTLNGGRGDDHLYGNYGNDTYIGGAGDDILHEMGTGGNDTYVYDSGHDLILGETSGTDKIVLADGIILADVSIERINPYDPSNGSLNAQTDLVIHVAGLGDITVGGQYDGYGNVQGVETLQFHDLSTINLSTLESMIYGTGGDDTLVGADNSYYLRDVLYGDSGNDTLDGGLGNDVLYGGFGNDIYHVGQGVDWIQDAYGTDQVVFDNTYDPNLFTFSFNELANPYDTPTLALKVYYDGELKVIIDQEFSGSGYFVEKISVDGVHDFNIASMNWDQHGTSAGENIYAIQAPGISNSVYGMGGNDSLIGSSKDDYLYGGDGDDSVQGNDGNDHLYGGNGNDSVSGGYGNDVIYGGDGTDTLTGGYGSDTFVFEADSAFHNVDTIYGFSTGEGDKINIADLLTGYTPGVSNVADFVSITTSGSSDQIFVDRDGAGTTYTAQQVATLYNVSGLDVHDLLSNGNLVAA